MRPRGLALALLLLTGMPLAGEAATLSVSPTRLDLNPGQPGGTVTVQNTGSDRVMLQVETLAWSDSTDVADLRPTRALVAVPPISQVEPGERHVIRVARRGAGDAAREQSFRLLISEVVDESKVQRGGVQFALRLSIPVFVTPADAVADPQWTLSRRGSGLALVLRNGGTAHVQVRRLELAGGGTRPVVIDGPTYVLAGKEHRWTLDQPELRGLGSLSVKAQTNLGDLDLVLPASGG